MKSALATEKIDFDTLGHEIMAAMQGQPGASDFDSVSPTARMFAAAENARDQFDLPEDINPSVIALATLSPKYMGNLRRKQLGWRAQQDRDWVAQTATAAESPLTPPAECSADIKLYNTVNRLTPVKRMLGAVAAIALGFGATAGTGLYVYEAQGRAAAGVTPTMDIGGTSYALVPDRSIFAGDGSSVEDTPVVGILAKIPGVPDTSPNHVTITTIEQVSVPDDITVATTNSTTAQNPVAVQMELTGQEYAADKTAATQLITLLQQNETTTGSTTYTITSTGITSDLYGGRTGRDDTNPTDGGPAPQQQLAVKRAEVGEQALRDAATDLGYSLDSVTIKTVAKEDLLTPQEQQRVTEIAASQGVSTEVLWQQYSSGALHPTILQKLGNMSRPGVSYLAQGTRLERQIKQEIVDAPGETTTFSFSGEGSIAIFGLPIAMLTAILQSLAAKKIGLGGWLLQSAARREIKQNMKRQTT